MVDGSGDLSRTSLLRYNLGSVEHHMIQDDKIRQNTLIFSRSFPTSAVKKPYGNISVVFEESYLERMLALPNDWTGGFNLILNYEGEVVFADGGIPQDYEVETQAFSDAGGSFAESILGQSMFVTYTKSEDTGWTYVSVYPRDQVLANSIQMSRSIVLFMIFASVLGIVAATILTRRNVMPINAIANSLSEVLSGMDRTEDNEYSLIQDAVDVLLAENLDMTERSGSQRQLIEDAVLHLLINNQVPDRRMLNLISTDLGMDLMKCTFLALRFSFEARAESQIARQEAQRTLLRQLKEQMLSLFDHPQFKIFVSEQHTMFILAFYPPLTKMVEGALRSWEEKINLRQTGEQMQMRSALGIGSAHNGVEHIYRTVEEAQTALDYSRIFEFGRPVAYRAIRQNITESKFSLKDHARMLATMKEGSEATAQIVFNEFVQTSILSRNFDVRTGEQLFYTVKSVLLEGLDYLDDEAIIFDVTELSYAEEDTFGSFMQLEQCFIRITVGIAEKKQNKGYELVHEVQEQLKQMYINPNLSVAELAEEYNVSDAYLNKQFKEVSSHTIASWLEAYRMRQAKQYLEERMHPVTEIASLVGYNSVESFRRAFKRYTGMSPSQYQSSITRDERESR